MSTFITVITYKPYLNHMTTKCLVVLILTTNLNVRSIQNSALLCMFNTRLSVKALMPIFSP